MACDLCGARAVDTGPLRTDLQIIPGVRDVCDPCGKRIGHRWWDARQALQRRALRRLYAKHRGPRPRWLPDFLWPLWPATRPPEDTEQQAQGGGEDGR